MKKISTIAVLSAMESEFKNFIPYMTNVKRRRIGGLVYHIGEIGKFTIAGLVTGIGQTNSAFSTGAIVHHFNPDILLFSGIGGALNKELDIGDVLVGKTVFSAELLSARSKVNEKYKKCRHGVFPDVVFDISKSVENKVNKLISVAVENIRFGTLVSSDVFPIPDYIPEKIDINTVDAIDMESAAFYQVCKRMNKPCVAIRSISNYAELGVDVSLTSETINFSSKKASAFSNKFILSLE